jgi:hypothetical protein
MAAAALFVGLLLGAAVGSTYSVARRSWSDHKKAKQVVKDMKQSAWGSTGAAVAWVMVGVAFAVIAFVWMLGVAAGDTTQPRACTSAAPVSGSPAPAHRTAVGSSPVCR